jgi:hypothetical protein
MAPIVGRFLFRGGRDGAIAQLGERVVRNDEVGGSIPPGSTTLRPSGFAWRSHVMAERQSVVPGEALLGEDGLSDITSRQESFGSGFAWRSTPPPSTSP